MKTKEFSPKEVEEITAAARRAVETDSPWVQLGEHFRKQREKAGASVEPRPIRNSK